MKIFVFDAPPGAVDRFIDVDAGNFILDVVHPLAKKRSNLICPIPSGTTAEPMRTFAFEGYENIADLLHTIPIFMCGKRKTENSDLLGAYIPNGNGCGSDKVNVDGPYIKLYLSEIEAASSENGKIDNLQFKWLVTKVLLHELGHAALDIFNCKRFASCEKEKILYSTDFGKWREESMANAMALRIIKESGYRSFYVFARRFMLSRQPEEYALGVLMEDFDYWDVCSVMRGKAYGVSRSVQDNWLKYAKSPDCNWEGLKKLNIEILKSIPTAP